MMLAQLRRWAAAMPEHPFVVDDDETVSYAEMAGAVSSYAGVLQREGIVPGDRVVLLCGNSPSFLLAWFALAELGAVTVPINPTLVGEGLRTVLSNSGAVVAAGEAALLAEKGVAFARLRAIVLPERVASAGGNDGTAATPAVTPSPASPNAILYTSGTTGRPKGAVLSHAAYRAAGIDMAASLHLSSADRVMVFLPLFHANPQMYAVTSVLEAGATLVLRRRFSASSFFDDARRFGATGFTYVGSVLSILERRHPGIVNDHPLRWCVGGGAPAPMWEAVEQRFGVAVRELYGMTETGGWLTMNTADRTRFASVGRPRPGVEIGIVDENDELLPAGRKGEIVARARRPHMFFDGYWQQPELTVEMNRNLWLHTGDRGRLDDDGFLFFEGRVKELIRRGGEMISPTEIELELLKHAAIRDCAIVGIPDEILGEEIKAVLVLADGARSFDPFTVCGFLEGRVAAHMMPRYVEIVTALPRTETQKVQRHLLAGTGGSVDLRARAGASGT